MERSAETADAGGRFTGPGLYRLMIGHAAAFLEPWLWALLSKNWLCITLMRTRQ